MLSKDKQQAQALTGARRSAHLGGFILRVTPPHAVRVRTGPDIQIQVMFDRLDPRLPLLPVRGAVPHSVALLIALPEVIVFPILQTRRAVRWERWGR